MNEKYEGDEKEGRRHGYGKCEYEIGDVYQGAWEEGRRHGRGIMRFANGNCFEGYWKYDKQHGKGIWTFSEGTCYEGLWDEGTAEVGGVWTFPDGTSRVHLPSSENVIENNLPDLSRVTYKGVCTIPSHDAVEGLQDIGASESLQTWIYANGARYTGGWKNNKEEGYGSWICS